METVTENKVLNKEELQTLKAIQEETQSLILELGEIELIKIQLGDRKEKSKEYLSELSQKEQDFTQSIFEKYGKVSINPSTGEINSIQNPMLTFKLALMECLIGKWIHCQKYLKKTKNVLKKKNFLGQMVNC